MNRSLTAVMLLFFGLIAIVSTTAAQDPPPLGGGLPKLDFEGIGGGLAAAGGGGEVKIAAEFKLNKDSRDGVLSVVATIKDGWHIYSITQEPGGPIASQLKVDQTDDFSVTGNFTASPAANIKISEFFTVPIEEHEGQVTWTAPIQLADSVDPEELTIKVQYSGQACLQVCIIVEETVEAEFAGYLTSASSAPIGETYRADQSHTQLSGRVHPSVVAPSDSFDVVVSAEADDTWHVYSFVHKETNPKRISRPTVFAMTGANGWPVQLPVASEKPIESEGELEEEPVLYYHEGRVSWTMRVTVPKDTKPGDYDIEGVIGYQACEALSCDLPKAASFSAKISVGSETGSEPVPLAFAKFSSYRKAESDAKKMQWADADIAATEPNGDQAGNNSEPSGQGRKPHRKPQLSLTTVLPMAFLAGLILNIMPCVLPVIGLKLMSFIKQAGENQRRVFTLNMAYVAGLMSVFLVLACVAVFMRLGWGEQFDRPEFTIFLAAIVFAFALSFLGVWEIPVPGFASSGKISELAESEGLSGAFFQGILTTILATPCAGPLLVPALAWAVQQPAVIAFSAYAFVGLGMAFPYLVVGVFPNMVKLLPKPGEWMNTFKHIMGFVLMGTVVLLMTFFARSYYLLPLVGFMMGLWASLWWVGLVPLYEPWSKQVRAWLQGAAFATFIGFISFGWPFGIRIPVLSDSLLEIAEAGTREEINNALVESGVDVSELQLASDPDSNELNWIPFNRKLLDKYLSEGKTVFVDFTAPS